MSSADELASVMPRRFRLGTKVFWVLVVLAALGIAAVFIFMPAQYRATSYLSVEPPRPPMTIDPPIVPIEHMARMVANQMVQLTSDAVLRQTLTSREVRETEWFSRGMGSPGHDVTDLLEDLKARLKVKQVPESNYIEVSFSGSSPTDAAAIVNTLVSKYAAQAEALAKTELQRALESYCKQAAEQERKLRAMRESLKEFAATRFRTPGAVSGLNTDADYYRMLREEAIRLEMAKLQAKTRHDNLKAGATQPAAAWPEVQAAIDADPQVQWLRREKLSRQVELAAMLPETAENGADVSRLRKQLAVLEDKLTESAALREKAEADRLTKAAEAEYVSVVQMELHIRDQLASAEAVLMDTDQKLAEYESVKREIDAMQRQYDQLQAFTNKLRMWASSDPDTGILQVPATRPSERDYGQAAGASIAIAGVPVLFGIALTLVRMIRRLKTLRAPFGT